MEDSPLRFLAVRHQEGTFVHHCKVGTFLSDFDLSSVTC